DHHVIELAESLEFSGETIVVGPDPNVARVIVEATDGFAPPAPLFHLTGPVTVQRLTLAGIAEAPVVQSAGETVQLRELVLVGGSSGLLVGAGNVEATDLGIGAPRLDARLDRFAGNGTGVFVGPDGGLTLGNSTVAGNDGHGIVIAPGDGIVVLAENFIGVREGGDSGYPNAGHGILLGRGEAQVGRNVVSNNTLSGIVVDAPADGSEVSIRGNQIGVEVGNGEAGIDVVSGGKIVIGSDRPDSTCTRANGCNVIVNSGRMGIRIDGATEAEVIGNFIGEDPRTGAEGNGLRGITVSLRSYLESENGQPCRTGSDCDSGTCHPEEIDPTTGAVKNLGGRCVESCPFDAECSELARRDPGAVVIGARTAPASPQTTCDGRCNVISGNNSLGVWAGVVVGPLKINGNFVGLASTGIQPMENDFNISISEAGLETEVRANLVAAGFYGIKVEGEYASVEGNWIGLDVNGEDPNNQLSVEASGIIVGTRDGVIADNVVAGAGNMGLHIYATSRFRGRIERNKIGMTADGQTPAGTGGDGMRILGCSDCQVQGNYIAASGGAGMVLGYDENYVRDFVGQVNGNFVGLLGNDTPAGNSGPALEAVHVSGSRIHDNFFGHTLGSPNVVQSGIAIRHSIDSTITDNTFASLAFGIDAENGTSITSWTLNDFQATSYTAFHLAPKPHDSALGDVDT
ncbi:MAG: right-handed parallel beta-helix repeat-containing protein, partial [Halobacteriales archaeon]|nr:right-handed parallel beta-helix repeat-containing protein [Halobacteriales archaeon]